MTPRKVSTEANYLKKHRALLGPARQDEIGSLLQVKENYTPAQARRIKDLCYFIRTEASLGNIIILADKQPAGSKAASQEFRDYDYWGKLNEYETAWLREFDRMYYSNSFKEDGFLPLTKQGRSEYYTMDNRRRRDIYATGHRSKAEPGDILDRSLANRKSIGMDDVINELIHLGVPVP